jgi:serine protease Do
MSRGHLFRSALAGVALAVVAGVVPARAGDPPPGDFGPVVAKLLPSVVSIYIRAAVQKNANGAGGASSANAAQTQYASQASQGSGFIIDPSGYIVTNRHVIQNAYEITVVMEDQRLLKATLVGKLQRMDLALLKVDSMKPLPAVSFGDSDKMKPGDAVIAIGNPLGLGGSVTAGVVSALNRNIGETPFDDYLQVDAAINHGNSGGPLFNAQGQVVGVNTAFFTPGSGGGSVGLGFAIPSDDVVWVLKQMRDMHALHPGWIDMQVQSVSDEIAMAFGLNGPGGAIVVSLPPDGVAAKAGIRRGDIVLKFGNQPIGDVRAFAREAAKTEPGTTVPLQIWRNGQTMTVPVPIVAYAGMGTINGIPASVHDVDVTRAMKAALFGLNLAPLTDVQRRNWGMPASQQGVLIDSVVPFGIADNHELRPGEVIVTVMGKSVTTPADVARQVEALHAAGATNVAFLIGNDNGTRWVALPFKPGAP